MLVPGKKGMPMRRMNEQRFAHMLQLLMAEPQTVLELSEQTDLAKNVIQKYVSAMRLAKPKLVRVAEWQQSPTTTSRLWVAAYMWGSGADVRKPPKVTNAERTRRYKARMKMRELDAIIGGAMR